MKVAAVVVTYNRCNLLLQCIHHLSQQQNAKCDILIIDNNSTDGTKDAVQALCGEKIKYKNVGVNLGGAGGFNFGIKWAINDGYDYIWIMDDDTLPEPYALTYLLLADIKLHGNYGFLSSRVLWTDGRDCPMNIQRRTPYREIDGFNTPLVPVAMASFVSLFLQAHTIQEFGFPISEFFIWSDDWEYTRRISRNKSCFAVRDSRVVHAMKDRSVANIALATSDRLSRYKYLYRNDVYLYRREGIKGWAWLLAKDCWHSLQVVFIRNGQKKERLSIIWNGFLNGIVFLKDYRKNVEGLP